MNYFLFFFKFNVVTHGNALHEAVMKGDYDIVVYLIENWFEKDLMCKNKDDQTPLDLALISGNRQIIEILCNKVNPFVTSLFYFKLPYFFVYLPV